MALPEKISMWDRFFNRYKREIHKEGNETWASYYDIYHPRFGVEIPGSEYDRRYIEYKVIDRVTGSETIEREYLS